jgi:hypothetical protein
MEKIRRFFQTSDAAASWSKPRKVVARVEASEQGNAWLFWRFCFCSTIWA